MALDTQLATATAAAQANALSALLNGGTVVIYSGAKPANANTALSGNTALATLTFQATAAPSTSTNVITFNTLTSGTAVATGTASFYRCYKSDGTTVVMDGSVGTSNANMIIGTVSIVSGASVSCSSFTHTVALAATGF